MTTRCQAFFFECAGIKALEQNAIQIDCLFARQADDAFCLQRSINPSQKKRAESSMTLAKQHRQSNIGKATLAISGILLSLLQPQSRQQSGQHSAQQPFLLPVCLFVCLLSFSISLFGRHRNGYASILRLC